MPIIKRNIAADAPLFLSLRHAVSRPALLSLLAALLCTLCLIRPSVVQAQGPGTLLFDRFGVTLALQPPYHGGWYNAFDWDSFAPTKHTDAVDWLETDWYGNWSTTNFSHTTIDHPSADGSDEDWYSSGGEWYDVEALYFDNDADNFYIVVVTSIPHYKDWGGGHVGVGLYDPRLKDWFRPGDLSINLGKNIPRVERHGTTWSYDYGVDIVHENRDVRESDGDVTMRDNDVGAAVYRTNNDPGGSRLPGWEDPGSGYDWYLANPAHNVEAYWEHSVFDPLSTKSSASLEYRGEATVSYYRYDFPGGQLENNAETYIIEITIPRSFFGADNPSDGDTVGLRWIEGCRNDGNSVHAVISFEGKVYDFDWGDAPEPTYPTLRTSNGARHIVVSGFFLGTTVDADPDGQPDALASGDDASDGSDDEDGVVFTTPLIPGSMASIDVSASAAGLLDAWIDFNGDGWDAGDHASQPLSAGANNLTFAVPAPAVRGTTSARFRFSSVGGLSFDGQAPDGEVEDYPVAIGLDLGDAPEATYPTLLESNGARHIIVPGLYLGSSVDADADGQPNAAASGDDLLDGSDDEDGVVFTTMLMPGTTASVNVSASAAGMLDAWIDFNGDGWDASDQIFANQPLAAGLNSLTFAVPATATSGKTYARFRFSSAGGLSFNGQAPDGEVEDYLVSIGEALDLGDAPEPVYPTMLASNGARHVVVSGFYLGSEVDAELDGQPDAAASGDDLLDGSDDEDVVVFTTMLMPGTVASVNVTASAAGMLDAWIDFNGDGWDAADQIFASQPLAAGLNSLTFAVPVTATSGTTYARFRLSTGGGLSFRGLAPDGEVEDYQVIIEQVPTPTPTNTSTPTETSTPTPTSTLTPTPRYVHSCDKMDSVDPVCSGWHIRYTISIENPSPLPMSSVLVTDELPYGTYFVSADMGGNGAYDSPTVTWKVDVPADSTLYLHLEVGTRSWLVGIVTNTVNVSYQGLTTTCIETTTVVRCGTTPTPTTPARTATPSKTGTPTPTVPVPGFPPCPYCVNEVVFQSDRDRNWEIYRAKADGTDQKRLTDNDAIDIAPNWYPDAQWIVFQSNRDGNWEIYHMNRDGGEQENLSHNPAADTAPFYSCHWIYFQSNRDGNWEIYRMNFDGSEQVRLTNHVGTDAQPSASCVERVVFQSNRDGNWEIYTMNYDGTDLHRLTYTSRDEVAPVWSPDGEWIVFQAQSDGGDWDLWIMDKDGGHLQQLTHSWREELSPMWWPSCEWIYFQTNRDFNWEIYRMDKDGTITERLTNLGAIDLIDSQVFSPDLQ